jgi:6-pyruvoyl-tetrahydropterin synthase
LKREKKKSLSLFRRVFVNVSTMKLLEFKVLNAIRQSQYRQLELFIRHNYNLNVTTKDGRNGLFFALDISDARKRRRMIRFCLDHGIDALHKENINGYTPLHEAIARQQVDSVQLLLANAGGEINWRSFDVRGRTILHQAVESNNVSIVEALVTVMNHYGVTVDIPDKNGLSPYLLATKLHLRDIAEILVNKGHASRQQSDLPTHRTANDWEIAGIEEHRLFVRDKLQQEIDKAMKEGKINKVRKLKRIYYSPLLLSTYEPTRRDSLVSMTTISDLNTKSSVSINEMIDRLPGGDIPESFVSSIPAEKTFHLERIPQSPLEPVPSSLPPISTTRQRQPTLTLNALVDLFQVVQ